MLQRMLTVNSAALHSLVTEREVEIERKDPVPAGTPLSQLVNIGMKDHTLAATILSELMEALGTQRQWVAE
jgi:small subunit ribosomal protein S29